MNSPIARTFARGCAITLLLISAASAVAQQDCRVRYLYDDAGNRTKRYWLCTSGDGNPKMSEQTASTGLDLASLKVVPNPASDIAILRLVNGVDMAKVEVMDMQGKNIVQATMSGDRSELDISSLTNGLYHVRVTVGEEILVCPLSIQR